MTESYTMSPSTTVSSSATTPGCLGSPPLSQSREDYDRLSPRRSYPRESVIDDEDSYSRSDYRMSNGRSVRTHESSGGDSVTTLREDEEDDEDDEELNSRTSSNGPSAAGATDDYFKPLKRLKMVPMQQSDEEDDRDRGDTNERGVKSFSILDILSHRPKAKIVRPWDTVESNLSHHHRHHLQQQPHHQHHLHHHHNHSAAPRDLSLMGMSLTSMSGSISEPPLSSSSSSGRSSVSDSGSPDPLAHHHSLHHGLHPGLHHPALQQQQQQQQFKRKTSQQHGGQGGHHGKRTTGQGSPLDALFQMTSKTFDAGEHSQGERFENHSIVKLFRVLGCGGYYENDYKGSGDNRAKI
ncbi:hypothetical protein WN55_01667 [Dufourea novaeangliae]|uniref:Uncharacterized protein n=1 Tax=Dufourea novaeangliae TaxID=178035 RepID=A0A154PGN6_DUFNO|nr:hypothetical protein WN55_01667 [Dufourea novaeangliae]